MQEITITIDTTTAAFDGTPALEVAAILRRLADRLDAGDAPPATLYDYDGKACGYCCVTEAD
jgi:hypothetical protein